jgi:hypothetical protein
MAGPNYKNIPTNQKPLIPQEGLPQQPTTQDNPCGDVVKGCKGNVGGTIIDWWPHDNHPNKVKYSVTFQKTSNPYIIPTGSNEKCFFTHMCDDFYTLNGNYCDNKNFQNIDGWVPNGVYKSISNSDPVPNIYDYFSDSTRWVRGCCQVKVVDIVVIKETPPTGGEGDPQPPTEGEGEPTNCDNKTWYNQIGFNQNNPTNGNYDGSIVANYNGNTINNNDFKTWYWKLPNGNKEYDYSINGLTEGVYTFYIEDLDGCQKEYEIELTEFVVTTTTATTTTTTTTPPLTTLTLNETPIVIEDCQDLLVLVKLYFSQPIGDCGTSDITASLLPDNDALTVEQLGVFDSVDDGFGNWVDLGIRVLSPISGATFNLNLSFIGLQTCCEYDIRVDDIRVDCYTDEERVVYDRKKCPGFELRRVIDNKKSWVYNPGVDSIGKSDDDNIIRNRGDRTLLENFGFVNRTFAPSVDADLPWRYTDYYIQSNILEQHSDAVINNKELMLTFNMCSDCCYEYSPCPKGFTLSGGTDICYSGNT